MTYLLDTRIIAELLSTDRDPNLVNWIDSQPEETLFISVVTLAELKQTIENEKSLKVRTQMNNWLINDMLARFNERIDEITAEVTLKWGELSARVQKNSPLINPVDSLTLAIAMVYNHTLVTNDLKVFEGKDVRLLDPCSNESH
jgi:toxin FitB